MSPWAFLTYFFYTGIGFYLNSTLLSDNSIVFLSDIGEGKSALYCLTDKELCCSPEATEGRNRSLWFFPDGRVVQGDTNAPVYLVRGHSSSLLNKRSSTGVPPGVYECLIPDARELCALEFIKVISLVLCCCKLYSCASYRTWR